MIVKKMMERPIFGIPILSSTQKIPFISNPRTSATGPMMNVVDFVSIKGYKFEPPV